jgi:hypothetical protein
LRQSPQTAQEFISVLMERKLAIVATFSLSGGMLTLAASLDRDLALALLAMLAMPVGALLGFALAATASP